MINTKNAKRIKKMRVGQVSALHKLDAALFPGHAKWHNEKLTPTPLLNFIESSSKTHISKIFF